MIAGQDEARLFLAEDSPSFEIVRATYVRQSFAPHYHDTFAVGVIEAGRARLRYRGETEHHAPGGVITIEPGEVHTGSAVDREGWRYRMFYLPPSLVVDATSDGEEMPHFRGSFQPDPALAAAFVAAHAMLEDGSDPLRAQVHLRMALELLCRRHAVGRTAVAGRESGVVRAVRDYLHEHYPKNVSLHELSGIAGLSTFRLIRVFKDAVGLPPHKYLAQVRIERARELLRLRVPISHVTFLTGFSDQSHFTRHFKRVTGVTPGEYARCYRSGPRVLLKVG